MLKTILTYAFLFICNISFSQLTIKKSSEIKNYLDSNFITEKVTFDSIVISNVCKVKLNSSITFNSDSILQKELYYTYNGMPQYLNWFEGDSIKLYEKEELIKIFKIKQRNDLPIDIENIKSRLINSNLGFSDINFITPSNGKYNDNCFNAENIEFIMLYTVIQTFGNNYPVPYRSNEFITIEEFSKINLKDFGLLLTFKSKPSDYPSNIEMRRYIFFNSKGKICSSELLSPMQ